MDELRRRLDERNADLPPGTFLITESVLDRARGYFEMPAPDELAEFDPLPNAPGVSGTPKPQPVHHVARCAAGTLGGATWPQRSHRDGLSVLPVPCAPGGLRRCAHAARRFEFHVRFEVGTALPQVRWSPDRAGFLVVTAETAEAASALARSLAAQVRFVTEPVEDEGDDVRRHRELLTELDQAGYVDAVDAGRCARLRSRRPEVRAPRPGRRVSDCARLGELN
nr:hypothetical protein [Kitasatospora sp. K002]